MFEILYRDERHDVRRAYITHTGKAPGQRPGAYHWTPSVASEYDGRTMDQVWADWCKAHPQYRPISIGPK
jgi:hypothetical protein